MIRLAFVDILPCPSNGTTADVVGQQGLPQRSHKQVIEAGLESRFRQCPRGSAATSVSSGHVGNCVREPFIQPALYGVYAFCVLSHLADPQEWGCSAPRAPAHWAAHVRVCMSCIKSWYPLLGDPIFLLLTPNSRVIITSRDYAPVIISRKTHLSSSEVLPTVYIKS